MLTILLEVVFLEIVRVSCSLCVFKDFHLLKSTAKMNIFPVMIASLENQLGDIKHVHFSKWKRKFVGNLAKPTRPSPLPSASGGSFRGRRAERQKAAEVEAGQRGRAWHKLSFGAIGLDL